LALNLIKIQSRINIGSDGTLARARLDGAPNLFSGALICLYITKHKQKNMGITLKKKLLGVPNFLLARAPKFLNLALLRFNFSRFPRYFQSDKGAVNTYLREDGLGSGRLSGLGHELKGHGSSLSLWYVAAEH